jgi:K+-dependent Na+/Ca+ exchanger-like protein
MLLTALIFIVFAAFYFLSKICDKYFIISLDHIAHRFNMSEQAAGATLMAVGSSSAELFIAVIALFKPGNHAAIGMGTIVGSAIFNILVIIGVAALLNRKKLHWQPIVRDLVFYSISILILLLVFKDGIIDLSESLIFIAIYIIYVVAVINWKRISPQQPKIEKDSTAKTLSAKEAKLTQPQTKEFIRDHYYIVFTISITLIALLSWGLVEAAVAIADILQIPSAIVALTILAIGSSVPDLISSYIVAKEGRGDMAIANAIGSNIFDILFGLGFPWLLFIIFSKQQIPVDTANLQSSVMLLGATVLAVTFLLIIRRWKIGNKSGFFLIASYLAYLVWAVMEVMG